VVNKQTIKLVVNPIVCDGHGLCAELFPEGVELDDWGYPIMKLDALTPELEPLARQAVAECPVRALRLAQAARAA
jgi:ferredoxin